jgi:hypothetical protein
MIAYIGVETVSNTGSCDLVDSTIVGSLVHLGQGYFYCFELSGELLQHCPGSTLGTILEKSLVILGFR